VLQAYCYVPDWARAAVELAEKRAELATFEDVPFGGLAFTAEEFRAFASRELGRPLTYAAFPWWLFTALSPFWELAREMREMRYLWNTPHALSSTKLAQLLPEFSPTPVEAVWRVALQPAVTSSAARRGAPASPHAPAP
jgi:hypothetical protein